MKVRWAIHKCAPLLIGKGDSTNGATGIGFAEWPRGGQSVAQGLLVTCTGTVEIHYLALMGDTADGYPGLRGWGAKSSAAVLAKFVHLESIPADFREWHVNAANASALADTLCRERDLALLFRRLATLRTDLPLFENVDQLRWNGPTPGFDEMAAQLDAARTQKHGPSARSGPSAQNN